MAGTRLLVGQNRSWYGWLWGSGGLGLVLACCWVGLGAWEAGAGSGLVLAHWWMVLGSHIVGYSAWRSGVGAGLSLNLYKHKVITIFQ